MYVFILAFLSFLEQCATKPWDRLQNNEYEMHVLMCILELVQCSSHKKHTSSASTLDSYFCSRLYFINVYLAWGPGYLEIFSAFRLWFISNLGGKIRELWKYPCHTRRGWQATHTGEHRKFDALHVSHVLKVSTNSATWQLYYFSLKLQTTHSLPCVTFLLHENQALIFRKVFTSNTIHIYSIQYSASNIHQGYTTEIGMFFSCC